MHRHFCDFKDHYWDCNGKAYRPLTGYAEPTICVCADHGVPMENGNHSVCTAELLACPKHCDEQLRAMGYEPGTSNMPQLPTEDETEPWRGMNGEPIIGFCLLCGKDYHTYEEFRAHVENDSAECAPYQDHKAKERQSASRTQMEDPEGLDKAPPESVSGPSPSTGILWLYGEKLLMACTPLSESEHYGDCLTSPASHVDGWEDLRQNGTVRADEEYDDFPRGRVVYDTKRDVFVLYADRCVLKQNRYVDAVIEEFGLPEAKFETKTDLHYRCTECLATHGSA